MVRIPRIVITPSTDRDHAFQGIVIGSATIVVGAQRR
jgi:hypothetical protein